MDAADTKHTKRKQQDDNAEFRSLIKQTKVVPSILKGVSAPRKPRVGEDFQATILPCPSQSTPKTQPQSDLPTRPSSATASGQNEQISQHQANVVTQ
jgi:hypothetical protein